MSEEAATADTQPQTTDFLSTQTATSEGGGSATPQTAENTTPQHSPDDSAGQQPVVPDKSVTLDALKAAGVDEATVQQFDKFLGIRGEDGKILGKFNDVDALVDGYRNLSTEIRKKTTKQAPEQYSEDALNGVEFSDEQLAKFKENGFDDKAVATITELIATSFLPKMQQQAQDVAELHLRASLGFTPGDDSYGTYMAGLAQWAQSNVPEDALNVLRQTPEGVLSLVNMRKAAIGHDNPAVVTSAQQKAGKDRHAELIQEMNDNADRYMNDRIYQQNLNKRIQEAAAQSA